MEHTQLSTPFTTLASLLYENERLLTFIDWPLDFITPSQLAKNGVFYLRSYDYTACIFCRGIIGKWEEGDVIFSEHKKHFFHCPFVQGYSCGNVPIMSFQNFYNLKKIMNKSGGTNYCARNINENENLSELGILQYSGPQYKEFLTYEQRLKSFTKWPEKVKQTPHELAETGFFSNGCSDHVFCFYCGIGLRNWKNEAVPWKEHYKYNDKCTQIIIKLIKKWKCKNIG